MIKCVQFKSLQTKRLVINQISLMQFTHVILFSYYPMHPKRVPDLAALSGAACGTSPCRHTADGCRSPGAWCRRRALSPPGPPAPGSYGRSQTDKHSHQWTTHTDINAQHSIRTYIRFSKVSDRVSTSDWLLLDHYKHDYWRFTLLHLGKWGRLSSGGRAVVL